MRSRPHQVEPCLTSSLANATADHRSDGHSKVWTKLFHFFSVSPGRILCRVRTLLEYLRIDGEGKEKRSQYASRLVEKGVPLSQVRDLLGHCSIVVSERYDRQVLATVKE